MLRLVPTGSSAPGPAMYFSKTVPSDSTTEKRERNAASAASLTGMTTSRTLAKMGGASKGRWGLVRSGWRRLTVRMTTKAIRRVSTGPPGCIAGAKASNIGLFVSKLRLKLSDRRYLPAASTLLSDKNGCPALALHCLQFLTVTHITVRNSLTYN